MSKVILFAAIALAAIASSIAFVHTANAISGFGKITKVFSRPAQGQVQTFITILHIGQHSDPVKIVVHGAVIETVRGHGITSWSEDGVSLFLSHNTNLVRIITSQYPTAITLQ